MPQKPPSEPRQSLQSLPQTCLSQDATVRPPDSDASGVVDLPTRSSSSLSLAAQKDRPVSTAASAPAAAEDTLQDAQAPAAKRRRIEKPQTPSPNTQPTTAHADANVPLPTTEPIEVVLDESNDAAPVGAFKQAAKVKKPKESTQAKRRKQLEETAAEIVADAASGLSARAKKPRKSAKGKDLQREKGSVSETAAGAIEASLGQVEGNEPPPKPKRKYTRKRTQQSAQDAAAEVINDAVQGSSNDPAKKVRKRKRAATPEGAEQVRIEPSEMKMADLCRDSRTGRMSKNEVLLRAHDRADLERKKEKELQILMGQAEPETEGPVETADERLERLRRRNEHEDSVAQNVPNTIIVNGQIQIDEDSLQIDRHAAAALERAAEPLDSIEESDLTRKMNQGTYMKRDKSGGWNELLTERFYDGLRMFGTDFEMISKMFPGRTRHKIKLKFVKEEKINHERIKTTLLGEKLAVDMLAFEKMAGTEFDDPEELEREMEEDRKRLEEETAQERETMEEQIRLREDDIAKERAAAGDTTTGEESSTKENRGRKGKKKGLKRKKGEPKNMSKRAQRAAANSGVEVPVDD